MVTVRPTGQTDSGDNSPSHNYGGRTKKVLGPEALVVAQKLRASSPEYISTRLRQPGLAVSMAGRQLASCINYSDKSSS